MFYDRFLELCMASKVTPTQVAREIGIRQSTVSMWKQQGTTPKYETLKKLADYFSVPVSNLLKDDIAGTIDTAIDVAMTTTRKESDKLVRPKFKEQSEDEMIATMLRATKYADERVYNLLLEYKKLSNEEKNLVLAVARQFNVPKRKRDLSLIPSKEEQKEEHK